jgi:hypothetical protein
VSTHVLNSNRVAENAPPLTAAGGFQEFASWVESSHFVGEFLRLPDGRVLANTWGFHADRPIGGILLSNPRGELLWEFESQLQVLEVDEGGRVLLWDREGFVPNEIRIARIR